MKLRISTQAGYCRGVENAVRSADLCIERGLSQGRAFYSIGSLIHNPAVVAEYEERGMTDISAPSDAVPGVALIRAHGIPDSLRCSFEDAGFELVDGTCPVITATKKAILKAASDGNTVILIGKEGHAETLTLNGPAVKYCVRCTDDAESIPAGSIACIAAQSTFPADEYGTIVRIISEKFGKTEILNKLCPVCSDRMKRAVAELKEADCAVVVGSPTSGNTTNLVNALKATGKPVFAVGTAADVDGALKDSVRAYEDVVLFSGTSAPMNHIRAVAQALSSVV